MTILAMNAGSGAVYLGQSSLLREQVNRLELNQTRSAAGA